MENTTTMNKNEISIRLYCGLDEAYATEFTSLAKALREAERWEYACGLSHVRVGIYRDGEIVKDNVPTLFCSLLTERDLQTESLLYLAKLANNALVGFDLDEYVLRDDVPRIARQLGGGVEGEKRAILQLS